MEHVLINIQPGEITFRTRRKSRPGLDPRKPGFGARKPGFGARIQDVYLLYEGMYWVFPIVAYIYT